MLFSPQIASTTQRDHLRPKYQPMLMKFIFVLMKIRELGPCMWLSTAVRSGQDGRNVLASFMPKSLFNREVKAEQKGIHGNQSLSLAISTSTPFKHNAHLLYQQFSLTHLSLTLINSIHLVLAT